MNITLQTTYKPEHSTLHRTIEGRKVVDTADVHKMNLAITLCPEKIEWEFLAFSDTTVYFLE